MEISPASAMLVARTTNYALSNVLTEYIDDLSL